MDTNQEIEIVKEQTEKAMTVVENLVVDSNESLIEAGNILKRVKQVGKMIKERKEEITKPMNEAIKSVRALFAPVEEKQAQAQKLVEDKMNTYNNAQMALAQKAHEENQAKLNDPNRTANSEVKFTPEPEVVKKTDDFHTRTTKTFKVIDKTKLPWEYLLADEVAIRKAMHAGIELAGVEYSTETKVI